MESFTPILALTALISLLFVRLYTTQSSHLNRLPGPWYTRWTHYVLKWHVLKGKRMFYIDGLHKKYGPTVRIAPNEVSVIDYDAVKTIYGMGNGFPKSPWYQNFTPGKFPNLFAILDPKEHAKRRKLFAPAFLNSSIMKFDDVIRSKVDMAVQSIKREAEKGPTDILKWLTFMATDITGILSFGKSFNALETGKKTQYFKDLDTILMISGMKAELDPLFSILTWLPVLPPLWKIHQRIVGYGLEAIREYKERIENNPETESNCILSKLISSGELSEELMAIEAGNIVVAGNETTSNSMTFLIYALLLPENQKVKEALIKEIAEVPDDADSQQLLSLAYLKGTVMEVLRLYSGAPGSLPRTCPSGMNIGSYYIPPGTSISTQFYNFHYDPIVFPEPEKINPDRWAAPTQKMKEYYNPWGMGSRICIGLHIATLSLTLTTFRFFKECPHARLAPSTTPKSMEMLNYFGVAPASRQCEIVF